MLSDALTEYGTGKRAVSMETLKMLAYACISDAHAGMFLAYTKTLRNTHLLDEIIAQMTVAADDQEALPDRFMVEVIRDLPRLVH